MAHFRTTIASKWDLPRAFAFMADFSNAAVWDPGVTSAHQVESSPIALGTRFELVAAFNGRQLPLNYEIVAFEAPHRVVLRAETDLVVSIDEITLRSRAGGTDVTYDAVLRPRGWLKLATPVVNIMFARIGEKARVGLQRELNA